MSHPSTFTTSSMPPEPGSLVALRRKARQLRAQAASIRQFARYADGGAYYQEIKNAERRGGLTPASARELVAHGHQVLIESTAGHGIGAADETYVEAGARIEMVLDQQYNRSGAHNLGRFRLMASDDPAMPLEGMPAGVLAALRQPPERRDAQAAKAVADYYRSVDPGLARHVKLLADHVEGASEQRFSFFGRLGVTLDFPIERR